jgi:putative oxidoreductase
MPEPSIPSMTDIGLLAARLLLALIFLHEGSALLLDFSNASVSVAKLGVSAPILAATVALQLACGAAIALGYYARAAAFALSVFCCATAFLFHARLSVHNEFLHFEKDLAIAGGMLALVFAGSGHLAITLAKGGGRPGSYFAERWLRRAPCGDPPSFSS